MKQNLAWQTVKWVFIAGTVISAIIGLTGCYSQKKFEKQLNKGSVYYRSTFAQKASELFPCNDVTGSDTIYIPADSSEYLNAIAELNNELLSVYDVQDSLIAALQIDTACKKYEVIIADLKKRNGQLKTQIANIKPITNTILITDTIPDKAAIFACEAGKNKAVELALAQMNEAKKWKKKSKNRLWTIIGIGGGIALYIAGAFIRRKVRK